MKSQLATKRSAKATCNLEVFSEVAKELGLSVAIVKEIFNQHSAFTKHTMESNTFDGVRWPYLGVFRSKPKEVQIINHLKGLTPEQQVIFKRQVKEGKYKAMREARLAKYESTKRPDGKNLKDRGPDNDIMEGSIPR